MKCDIPRKFNRQYKSIFYSMDSLTTVSAITDNMLIVSNGEYHMTTANIRSFRFHYQW